MDVDTEGGKPQQPEEPEYRIEVKTRTVKQEVPVSGSGLDVPQA